MIYVIAHKPFQCDAVTKKKGYQVLQVGSAPTIKGSLRDNTGASISEKNPSYCELTGHYWMYQNTSDDYIGLVHYRRYFVNHLWHKIDEKMPLSLRIMSFGKAKRLLKKYDIIVPERWTMNGETILEHWNHNHHPEDLQIVRDIIDRSYPEMMTAFDEVMNQKGMFLCNMFVMGRTLFDDYSKFLFSVLFEAEKSVNVSTTSAYQKRVFGFLSERLLNVWIRYKGLKVYEAHVFFNKDL